MFTEDKKNKTNKSINGVRVKISDDYRIYESSNIIWVMRSEETIIRSAEMLCEENEKHEIRGGEAALKWDGLKQRMCLCSCSDRAPAFIWSTCWRPTCCCCSLCPLRSWRTWGLRRGASWCFTARSVASPPTSASTHPSPSSPSSSQTAICR